MPQRYQKTLHCTQSWIQAEQILCIKEILLDFTFNCRTRTQDGQAPGAQTACHPLCLPKKQPLFATGHRVLGTEGLRQQLHPLCTKILV